MTTDTYEMLSTCSPKYENMKEQLIVSFEKAVLEVNSSSKLNTGFK